MSTRTRQLQIRVTPEEKAALRRLAAAAGTTISAYVLQQALPTVARDVAKLVGALRESPEETARLLGSLQEALEGVPQGRLAATLAPHDLEGLSVVQANYVAAILEQEATRRAEPPPECLAEVAPPDQPHFGWALRSMRPHQMRVTPVAFKRRNLFFDPTSASR